MLKRMLTCVAIAAALAAPAASEAQPAELPKLAESHREFMSQLSQLSKQKELAAAERLETMRQLATLREQLARSAGEIARLSSRATEPALRAMQGRVGLPGRRLVLGLNIQDTDLGARVNGVTPNGLAAQAGIAVGDTIVAINGVDLARAPAENGLPRSPSATLLGEYFGVEEGVLVVRAGRAEELGLRDGDVIIEIGGREPQSPQHALRILTSFEPGESLQTAIMRQQRRQTLSIRVPQDAPETPRQF